MSQIGQVQVNFNLPEIKQAYEKYVKTLVIGLCQRGPVYKPTPILDIESFLIIFGQPTNEYEFDFFQAVKSIVDAGGMALCYRIPYSDPQKKLYEKKFEYYIADSYRVPTFVLKDQNHDKYYEPKFRARGRVVKLVLVEVRKQAYVDYFVLKAPRNYYRLYVKDGKMYVDTTTNQEDINEAVSYLEFNKFPGINDRYAVGIREYPRGRYRFGLYEFRLSSIDPPGVYYSDHDPSKDSIYDVFYKLQSENANIFADVIAKLTFTPINDFNGIMNHDVCKEEQLAENQLPLRRDCYNIKTDIDFSQIFGIFPILFGCKDGENLRNMDFEQLYYFDSKYNETESFEIYDCKYNIGEYGTYTKEYVDIIDKIPFEFEKSVHFQRKWYESEIAKLIDTHVPQDTELDKNALGIAFVALYLDDEHKLDYKILESYYGLVGTSNTRLHNLEDLVNQYSSFFHLDIDGTVESEYYLRALNKRSFSHHNSKYNIIPFFAPYYNADDDGYLEQNRLDTNDIFADEPNSKYDRNLSQPLSKLYTFLDHTEFLNSVPFDYVIAPGLLDALLISNPREGSSNNSIVSYYGYTVPIVNFDENNYPELIQSKNIESMYRLLGMYTGFGDKGTICIADIPKVYNQYFKDKIDGCHDKDLEIRNMLSIMSTYRITNLLDSILPKLSGSREIYDRVYPVFNYQTVDNDDRLTRYHKFAKPIDFEMVPPSSMIIGPYVRGDVIKDFAPIAGPRTTELFAKCHKSLIEKQYKKLFKIMFDMFEISSLINDSDNGTYPVQQVTWKNSKSVLKQLHAFRIYIEIRRRTYDILRAFLYEPNTSSIRSSMQNSLNYLLSQFKDNFYIDDVSNAKVWADTNDIDNHVVHIEMTIGIYGAIVKIIVNMNLTDMKIEYVE